MTPEARRSLDLMQVRHPGLTLITVEDTKQGSLSIRSTCNQFLATIASDGWAWELDRLGGRPGINRAFDADGTLQSAS